MSISEIRSRPIWLVSIIFTVIASVFSYCIISAKSVNAENFENRLYADTIFDNSYVHRLDIQIENEAWRYMVENATEELYVPCSITYDDTVLENIAIRPKGNSSLKSISSAGTERFSFKFEFDHFNKGKTLDGLDKLALNNLGQDQSCMKDYLTYHMMNEIGIPSSLSSYVFVTVNGKDFGLYLAVEAIEDAFANRCYGEEHGNFYKPDSFAVDSLNVGIGIEQLGDVFSILKGEPYKNLGAGDRVDFLGDLMNIMLPHMGISPDAAAGMYISGSTNDYKDIFDTAVFTLTESQKKDYIRAVKKLAEGDVTEALYADDVLKYFIVHGFVNNYDGYTGPFVHNFYYYENNGRLSIVPWDYNLGFGGFTYESAVASFLGEDIDVDMIPDTGMAMDINTSFINYPIDEPYFSSDMQKRPMISKLLENDTYMELYHEYYKAFIDDMFTSGKFEKLYNDAHQMIMPYIERGRALYTMDSFMQGSKTIHDFCVLRAESVTRQLDGTLPATLAGQSASYENLVNAGDLNLSKAIDFSGLAVGVNSEDIPMLIDILLDGAEERTLSGMTDSIMEIIDNPKQGVGMIKRLLASPTVRIMIINGIMPRLIVAMVMMLFLISFLLLSKYINPQLRNKKKKYRKRQNKMRKGGKESEIQTRI